MRKPARFAGPIDGGGHMRNWEGLLSVKGTAKVEDVAAYVRGLRQMARLGKLAQSAIAQIERDGFVEGRFPVFNKSYGNTVENARFSKAVEIRRDMMPSFDDLKVELRDARRGKHGGTEYRRASIFLTGTGCVHVQSDVKKKLFASRLDHVPIIEPIGYLRLKRNGPPSFDNDRNVFQVYEEFKWDGAKKYAEALAKAVSNAVSNVQIPGRPQSYKSQQVSHYFERVDTQVIRDLEVATRNWLIEEGHIERLSRDLRVAAKLFEVMSA